MTKTFTSFAGFASHLGHLIAAEITAEHVALETASKHVQAKAKDKFGVYQPGAGDFAAWRQLAESTQAERERLGYPPNEPLLREGDLRDSIERTVHGSSAEVGSNDDVMVYQELGTKTILPRSVLGSTGFEQGPTVMRIIGEHVVLALGGRSTGGPALITGSHTPER